MIGTEQARIAYDKYGDFDNFGIRQIDSFYEVMILILIQTIIPFFFGLLYTISKDDERIRRVTKYYISSFIQYI